MYKAFGVFPCIKVNQTAQPVRDGPHLQLVAKTLYTVDGFFHAPPASDWGQFHWWTDVFKPAANFIASGCRVA